MIKNIKFDGISRMQDIDSTGNAFADDLVNMRLDNAGNLQAIERKSIKYAFYENGNPCIIKCFEHRTSSSTNLIVIKLYSGKRGWTAQIEHIDDTDGKVISLLFASDNYQTEEDALKAINGIDIAATGNFISFNTPVLHSCLFYGGEYIEGDIPAESPILSFSVTDKMSPWGEYCSYTTQLKLTGEWENSYTQPYHFGFARCDREELGSIYSDAQCTSEIEWRPDFSLYVNDLTAEDTRDQRENVRTKEYSDGAMDRAVNISMASGEKEEIENVIKASWANITQSDKNFREGYILICSAFELFDGSIINVSEPKLIHLGTYGKENITNNIRKYVDYYYNPDKVRFTKYAGGGTDGNDIDCDCTFEFFVRHQNLQKLTFSKPDIELTDAQKILVKKIVYFTTAPVSMYDFEHIDFLHLHYYRAYSLGHSTKKDGSGYRYLIPSFTDTNNSTWTTRMPIGHSTYDSESEEDEGLKEYIPTNEDISKWILYKAAEFNIDSSADSKEDVNFSSLTSGDVLKSDTSGHKRFSVGGLMSFNRRLHAWQIGEFMSDALFSEENFVNQYNLGCHWIKKYYDSYVKVHSSASSQIYEVCKLKFYSCIPEKRMPYTLSGTTGVCFLEFKIEESGDAKYYYKKIKAIETTKDGYLIPPFISFPDSRCTEVRIIMRYAPSSSLKTYLTKTYKMTAGSANFAFCFTLDSSYSMSPTDREIERHLPYQDMSYLNDSQLNISYEDRLTEMAESNTLWSTQVDSTNTEEGMPLTDNAKLIVSDNSNPYTFPPENDMRFDDDVISAVPATMDLSLQQSGNYTTYVFTKKNIVALQLGTSAFYSSFSVISDKTAISRNIISTPAGVVFVSKDEVNVLRGLSITAISNCLRYGRQFGLLENTSLWEMIYDKRDRLTDVGMCLRPVDLSQGDGGYREWNNNLINEYSVIGFDDLNKEIIISNMFKYDNSAVYSADKKMWYETDQTFYSFHQNTGCRSAIGVNACLDTYLYPNAIVNLNDESSDFLPDNADVNQSTAMFTPVLYISRPITAADFSFKTVYRVALRGHLRLNIAEYKDNRFTIADTVNQNTRSFSFSVFASNDLNQWRMVAGKCWHGETSQIITDRIKYSYKYYIVALGGYAVPNEFKIFGMQIDGTDKYNNRNR